MKNSITACLALACFLIGGFRVSAEPVRAPMMAPTEETASEPSRASVPKTYLIAIGKGRAADSIRMQERAIVAVRKVTGAAKQFQPMIVVKDLAENVMTREQYGRGEVEVKVNGEIVRNRLREIARTVTPEDTVIIYTHTHGTKGGPERPGIPGGLSLDPGNRRTGKSGVLSWEEYSELLLDIPAKNVVALTMACFSGGLIERLNSPPLKQRWQDRRDKEGRCFIVLTSQNKELKSPPILKNREVINPFTYAVSRALSGEADGFELKEGRPDRARRKDGIIDAGEMIDYILYWTANVVSDHAQQGNTAKPQMTGSFSRHEALLVGSGETDETDEQASR